MHYKGVNADNAQTGNTWKEVIKGVRLLFGNKILRFSLSIEFISAVAGAMVLVNTVGLVKPLCNWTTSITVG
jgi:NRE family putative nickel resistance protein-like MFS transporter